MAALMTLGSHLRVATDETLIGLERFVPSNLHVFHFPFQPVYPGI